MRHHAGESPSFYNTSTLIKNDHQSRSCPEPDDVPLNEGEAYAGKLEAAGVNVTAVRDEGLIQASGFLNAISQIPAVRAALHQAAKELKKHLK